MDFSAGGSGRMFVALAMLAGLAAAVWFTIDPGRYRSLALILLGFFAVRILLGRMKVKQEREKLMER